MTAKRILIIGGVAGGATAAAHSRRLSEEAEIILFERGPHVSFANCGLPYFIGGEIKNKADLLVQTPEGLRSRFNLDVRVMTEVVEINPAEKSIRVLDNVKGKEYTEKYDALIISTGASPIKPPIPGIHHPDHFSLRSIPDAEAILKRVDLPDTHKAVVVGGGFIGLEIAEQLHRRGLQVSIVEALPQVMAPFDPEMAAGLHQEIKKNNVDLHLGDGVSHFDSLVADENGQTVVVLNSGKRLTADLVILGVGVKPESELAKKAGLQTGARGGIVVNDTLRTSDGNIWAIGDAIEVRDFVTGEKVMVPLAGPANRQGRIVAENIFGGSMKYPGTLGTAVLRIFDCVAACTGASEKTLRRLNIPSEKVYLHPPSHASYYPGAHSIAMKLLFDPKNGKILGAQALGKDGVDKRIDVLATAIKAGMTVHDLEDLELAYAPPVGSAKDPVNLAGMVAQHVVRGDVRNAHWDELEDLLGKGHVLLDVRDTMERAEGCIEPSLHVPLPELHERMQELPKENEIIVYCQSGQRSYFACRQLALHGYKVKNLSGAYKTWKMSRDI
ncbi:MAG: FAD-dependent oxidoreductase [Candidatus Nitronauta litoralis]|uniref:FAD-dependent oxidoreductase n=1 Tax=Candidatus Nitronauta litoralis TaxID=2705533 RepID=A0A7T0BTX4_9BACT|nr:MAG: FAD-dependent oxidoreductase [Candidatus Nitronauta litoralis]